MYLIVILFQKKKDSNNPFYVIIICKVIDMMEKVIHLLEEQPLIIPRILFSNFKKMELDEKELLLLIYLLNEKETEFNPTKVQADLGYSLNEILDLVNRLTMKNCLSFRMEKHGTKQEEHLDFSELYKKLSFFVMNEKETKETKSNIYDVFEREFGRTLSSMEYEIIGDWLNGEFSEELVLLALKEAVYNNVSNLRYIDKILYEWKKKGFQTKEDVERDKENFQNRKKETKKLFDYDWLNE